MKKEKLREFRRALRQLERQFALLLKGDGCCRGVSMSQCHVLMEIEAQGEVTTGLLVRELGLDKSTLSRTIDGLVGIGLLQRRTHPDDRRCTLLRLTRQGRSVCDKINSVNDRYFSGVLARISVDGRSRVVEALEVLAEAMAAVAVEADEGRTMCEKKTDESEGGA